MVCWLGSVMMALFRKSNANFPLFLVKIIILAAVYHAAARIGLMMAYVQTNTSPVWPPAGIALAALLVFGTKLWPGVGLGVLLGSLLTGAPLNVALGMAIGNTLEAFIAATVLLRVFGFHNSIDRVQDAIAIAVVSLITAAISASFGAGTLLITGIAEPESISTIWITWWVGNLLGALVVAPFLLVWLTSIKLALSRRILIEGAAIFLTLTLITTYVFSEDSLDNIYHQSVLYLIFPVVIWAALRFRQRGSSLSVVLVSGIAIWGTVRGYGPFSFNSINDSLVLLQTFMVVVSLTAMVLASATAERQMTATALRQRADELATLNESSRIFLDSIDLPHIYNAVCQHAVTRLGVNAAWIETNGRPGSNGEVMAAYGVPFDAIPDLNTCWETRLPSLATARTSIRKIDELPEFNSLQNNNYKVFAAIPMMISGSPFGMLKLLSSESNYFRKDRLLLIQSYTNLASVVIQNSWLLEEVRESNKLLHALSQRLIQAQEGERLHLSRELHDESGQLLAGLMVQLGLLERNDKANNLHRGLAELKKTTSELQENLHKLAVNLRPASLDHLGLVTALNQYVNDFGEQYDIKIGFESVGFDKERLPSDLEIALFRVVQESLTNVALHARASNVDVLLSRRKNHVAVTVEDDGVGFFLAASSPEHHLGLFGMRERSEMLDGNFTVESSPGKGTTINVEVPLDA